MINLLHGVVVGVARTFIFSKVLKVVEISDEGVVGDTSHFHKKLLLGSEHSAY